MASRKQGHVRSKRIEGSAESIPLDAHAVDAVVTTWTPCTIPDVTAALMEMRRVLKQGYRSFLSSMDCPPTNVSGNGRTD